MRATVAVLVALSAAGCSDNASMSAVTDAGAADTAMDTTLLSGRRVASGEYTLLAYDGSNVALLADPSGNVSAISLATAGDKPHAIVDNTGTASLGGSVVIAFTTTRSGSGDLLVWAAGGALWDTQKNVLRNSVFVTEGGAWVVFAEQTAGNTATLWVARPDGSSLKALATGLSLADGCSPAPRAAAGKIVVGQCTTATEIPDGGAGDGGAGPVPKGTLGAISAYDPVSGAAQLIANGVVPDNIGYAEHEGILFLQSSYDLTISSYFNLAGGGAPRQLDSDPPQHSILGGNNQLFYITAAQALRVANIKTPGAPITLATNAVNFPAEAESALSPDGTRILYSQTFASKNQLDDLYSVATAGGSAATPLVTTATTRSFGSAFTTDGTRALYITGATPQGVGVLHAMPVAGGADAIVDKAVWQEQRLGGTSIAYNNHYQMVGGSNPVMNGRADIYTVDVASNGAPRLIATQAQPTFFVSAARAEIVYTYLADSANAGVYIAPASP